MAKNKRKVSASQRDKIAIATAKILKKKGVLSKQTKLHGGQYLSRAVLKKVQEFQHAAKSSYTALKVDKSVAKRAKAEGYQVVQGNRVIIPRDHDFIKRVKSGMVSGIKPVKGGFMSEVQMNFTGKNAADLLDWLEAGNLDDMKLEHEHFAFRLSGDEGSPHGMSYRTFSSTQSIREYLKYYSPSVETTGFKLYRLHPEDTRTFIKTKKERFQARIKSGRKNSRGDSMRRTYSERMQFLDRVNPAKAEKIREKQRAKDKARYAKQKLDPDYVAKNRKKARDAYHAKKKG